jgi:large-conductance mechanosensitive channel
LNVSDLGFQVDAGDGAAPLAHGNSIRAVTGYLYVARRVFPLVRGVNRANWATTTAPEREHGKPHVIENGIRIQIQIRDPMKILACRIGKVPGLSPESSP